MLQRRTGNAWRGKLKRKSEYNNLKKRGRRNCIYKLNLATKPLLEKKEKAAFDVHRRRPVVWSCCSRGDHAVDLGKKKCRDGQGCCIKATVGVRSRLVEIGTSICSYTFGFLTHHYFRISGHPKRRGKKHEIKTFRYSSFPLRENNYYFSLFYVILCILKAIYDPCVFLSRLRFFYHVGQWEHWKNTDKKIIQCSIKSADNN